MFPDIRFLKELQEQTQKQSQLKHLLILASRILAVLALVAAFAQPFFSKDADKVQQGPKAISIYIDNSFSMGIEQGSLSLLDLAKGKAKQLIESASSNDLIQILTNDFGYKQHKFLSKSEALRELSTLQTSPITRNAALVLEKQRQLLMTEPGYRKQQIYISDFQKSGFPANLKIDDSIKKFFLQVKATGTDNLSIDTVYFDAPSLLLNEANSMTVRLKNNGKEDRSTSISVNVNHQLKSVVNASVKAGSVQLEKLNVQTATAGTQKIEVFINDHPVTFDDTFYVAGKVNSNYAVMVLNQSNANAYLSSVFKPGLQFRMDNHQVAGLRPEILKNYSLIILNGVNSLPQTIIDALNDFVLQGGSILVFAPTAKATGNINTLLQTLAGCNYQQFDTSKSFVSSFNKSHELFRDLFTKTPENIDLPIAYQHFVMQQGALSAEQKLFTFSNGDAFLSMFKAGNGKLYVCASSAEATASNFPKSYWFLPLIYKMAYSTAENGIQAVSIGRQALLQIPNIQTGDKAVYHMYNGTFDAIPEQRAIGNRLQLNFSSAVEQSGLYAIALPNAKDSLFTGLNYSREESDLTYWSTDELSKTSKIKNATWLDDTEQSATSINELQHGMPLWKVCIILALLFLLIEILLIRYMK